MTNDERAVYEAKKRFSGIAEKAANDVTIHSDYINTINKVIE